MWRCSGERCAGGGALSLLTGRYDTARRAAVPPVMDNLGELAGLARMGNWQAYVSRIMGRTFSLFKMMDKAIGEAEKLLR